MILYAILCIVVVFFLFKKEGFKEGAEPAPDNAKELVQLKERVASIDERVKKIEKDISDLGDS
jgi:cell division protein FtsB